MPSHYRIPDGELEVMQAIWSCSPPVSRKEIEEIIIDKHPIAITTLLTFLSRLTKKGFLRIEKAGKSNLYYPLISKEEYTSDQGDYFFHNLCNGNILTFASALCDSGFSKEELDELRQILKEHSQ